MRQPLSSQTREIRNGITQTDSSNRDCNYRTHWRKLGGLLSGARFEVVATDPAPNAEDSLRKYVEEAWELLTEAGLSTGASRDRLEFSSSIKRSWLAPILFRRTDLNVPTSRRSSLPRWMMPRPPVLFLLPVHPRSRWM